MVRSRKPEGTRLRARRALCAAACAAASFVALGVFASPAHAADGKNLHGAINQLTNNQLTNGLGLPVPTTLPPVNISLPHVNVPDPSTLVGQVTGTVNSLVPNTPPASGSSSASTPPQAAPRAPSTAAPRASDASTSRIVPRGELRPTGPTAVLHLAQSATVLLALAFGAIAFLVVQSSTERRNPRLVEAPVDRRDFELEFR